MDETPSNQAHDSIRSLLATARQLIDQGNPSAALQAVMAAMKSHGGEQAVFRTLQRTRELYRNRMQAAAAADELASLFAECAVAEAQPPAVPQPIQRPHTPGAGMPPPVLPNAVNDASILATSGRKQIVLDAFSDGSSFICLQCGGLVSSLRRDEHLAYWCGKD
ncbi:uncharacterized protein M6B38_336150 [Iris pallida]|uniref:C2HC zinc finger plants domain-containing protein n=1 Tax=Iris pallida TaxID=29817 RepID=A0AAX6GZK7_IRIPA|nr:uncharacterized protein M6B38_186325 [Iris pallida]KAJ6834199.1 uncharacterized protein M6B38_336150 [Iris pallida]